VLIWCAANAVVEMDVAGNLKVSRRKSSEKIDGIVAMAVARWMAQPAEAEFDFSPTFARALNSPEFRDQVPPCGDASAVLSCRLRVVQTYPLEPPAGDLLLPGGHVSPQSSTPEERQIASLLERGGIAAAG
jgi:hypothetical protein